MPRKKRRFSASIPTFDPEVDAFYIDVGDKEYTCIVDLACMFQMQESGLISDEGQMNFNADTVTAMITMGLQRKHPEITTEEVEGWLSSPASAVSIMQGFGAYIEHVQDKTEQSQGEVRKTRGSTSGRTRSTTSASRAKKPAASSRAPSKR